MKPLTEQDIRASFVNASKREAAEALLPDLGPIRWESLDYLGWRDAKLPQVAYVVMPLSARNDDVDGQLVGVRLRAVPREAGRRRMQCAWCQDIVSSTDATMYVAKRAGASGRRGNTVGTVVCEDFGCSANVRRLPSLAEMGKDAAEDEKAYWIGIRVEDMRARAADFVRLVRDSE